MARKEYLLCAVRDAALGAFAAPMTLPSMGIAQRTFADEVNRKESPMHVHPEDYELWLLGTFEEDSGELKPLTPECVARAKDVIVKEH